MEIIPGLYLGSAATAHNAKFIKEANIQSIVNITRDVKDADHPGVDRLRVLVNDDGMPSSLDDMSRQLDASIRYIARALSEGKHVLVHCMMGKQRSAALVACYLVRERKMGVYEAIQYIKERRRGAFHPRINFRKVIESVS